jgi:Lysophospholipase L1 and related esterases
MSNFNVAFLGGSITQGVGASKYENSFVHKVSEYIKELYKDKNINIINCGIDGTGSEFGLFRLERDVINKNADLVFVEFAVNDRIVNSQNASITTEGIIRKLSKCDNPPAVVFLITSTGLGDACSSVHKRVAYYYNISCIDIQDYVYKQIGKDEYVWEEISIDNLHPNDKGHEIYAQYIIDEIVKNSNILENKPVKKNNPINKYEFKNPEIISYEKAIFYGQWREENIRMPGKIELAAVTDNIGDCLEFYFKGKYFGITTLRSRESGALEFDIDGTAYYTDLYFNSDPYFTCGISMMNLSAGEHKIILRVSENKNAQSFGNKIVIGGFLVEDLQSSLN